MLGFNDDEEVETEEIDEPVDPDGEAEQEIEQAPEEPEFKPVKKAGTLVVEAPVGISTEDFRSTVMGASALWSAYKVAPTAQGLIQLSFCSLPMSKIIKIMQTAEFAIAMGAAGVPWGEHNKLTPRQLACLEVVTNPHRNGTLNTRLKAAGVSEAEYKNWRMNPIFEAQYLMLTKDVLTAWTSDIDTALVQGAINGRLDNIKYVNELTGRHDPNKKAALDVEDVLRSVVNIVQMAVTQISDLTLRQNVINAVAVGVQSLLETAKIAEAAPQQKETGFINSYKKELRR